MRKILFLMPLFLFADVDPFNLNTNNPRYLTPTEKAIYNNKKEINKLKKRVTKLEVNQAKKFNEYDLKIEQLFNKASSFSVLVDSINAIDSKVAKLKKELDKNSKNDEKLTEKLNNLESEIETLKQSIKELSKIQNQNFLMLKDLILKKLSSQSKATNSSTNNLKSKNLKEIFNEAKQAFLKGNYDKAKKLFSYTYQKNYLRATSLFYLGEIAYVRKLYKDALGYYKKSVQIYSKKASYMDRLLYHTGRSFMKLGNKKLAVLTFKKLIHDYPKSIYTKFAKKDLEKLK